MAEKKNTLYTIWLAMMNVLQNLIRRKTKSFFFLPLAPIVCSPAVYSSKIGTLRSLLIFIVVISTHSLCQNVGELSWSSRQLLVLLRRCCTLVKKIYNRDFIQKTV